MRLYRLCEYKGRIDIGAVLALRRDISIADAIEIETAGLVLADHTAEFADFAGEYYKTNKESTPNTPATAHAGSAKPTKEQLLDEIAHRKERLEACTATLLGHRRAIAMAASGQDEPPGRLRGKAIDVVDASVRSHTEVIAYIEKQLAEYGE